MPAIITELLRHINTTDYINCIIDSTHETKTIRKILQNTIFQNSFKKDTSLKGIATKRNVA